MTVFKSNNIFALLVATMFSFGLHANENIVHDAEFYILKAQHSDRWEAEDREFSEKLAALQKKHGRPPNLIHIML